jgi:hypothetical protein
MKKTFSSTARTCARAARGDVGRAVQGDPVSYPYAGQSPDAGAFETDRGETRKGKGEP